MKRNKELVRQILLAIENLPDNSYISQEDFPQFDPDLVAHHLFMLMEVGYVKAISSMRVNGQRDCKVNELTWEGHDYLDEIRA
ncbi:DUF2513 domain-containing protein [Alcaligenes sp. WGS1538]|uniref:DUF2513 domain-containing protein n=1 Tax=Alcaligenes sp. WGS1538 TaxID=3366811 RepID=UPI00372D65B0